MTKTKVIVVIGSPGSGGGCFDQSCNIIVYRKEKEYQIKIKDVKIGDKVKIINNDNTIGKAVVRYVVKINRNNRENIIKFLDTGLMITKNHPVKIDGIWKKPIDMINNNQIILHPATSNIVYNLVLNKQKIGLLVNNTPCMTFGHNIKEAWDSFYASNQVIEILKSLPLNDGIISINGSLKNYLNPSN